MNQAELMAAGALGISVLALLLAVTAAWPTLKPWLEEVRDLVLWVALAAVALGGGWFAWQNMQKSPPATPESSTLTGGPSETHAAVWPPE